MKGATFELFDGQEKRGISIIVQLLEIKGTLSRVIHSVFMIIARNTKRKSPKVMKAKTY